MNPFIYGEEVQGENFCNRVEEIKELVTEIQNFQNILIYSPRRFGKTSLIKEVFKKVKKNNFLTIYIDLYPVISEDDFIRITMKAVSNVIGGSGANILKRIKKYFKQVSSGLYLTLSEDGTPSVGLNLSTKRKFFRLSMICLTAFTPTPKPPKNPPSLYWMNSNNWGNWKTTGLKKFSAALSRNTVVCLIFLWEVKNT